MENAPSRTRKLKRLKRRQSSSDENDFWSDDKPLLKKETPPIDAKRPQESSNCKSSEPPGNSRQISKSAMSHSPVSRSNSPGILAPTGSRKQNRAGRDANGRLKLQRMCDKGKYEEAKELIMNGADVNDRDYAGNTAIHEAALKGHAHIVELLIDNGAMIDVRSGPYDLDTPLIDAAANDHLNVVRLLLKRGADPRIFNAQGKTPMDSIQEDKANGRQIENLLREASLRFRRKRDADRSTPNGDASDDPDNHHDFMDPANYPPGTFPPKVNDNALSSSAPRRRGARAQAIRNDLLWMDLTTRTGREQVYRKAADGDIEFVGNFLENGWKPDADCLALAAKHGHTDVVGLLLAFGADSDGLNEDGETALQQTIGRGHFATVKLLLDSGADPNVLNHDGKSCLELAQEALSNDDKEVALISDAIKAFKRSNHKSSEHVDRVSRHERHEKDRHRQERVERVERSEKMDRKERLEKERHGKHEKSRKSTPDEEELLERKKKRKYLEGLANERESKRKELTETKAVKKHRTELKSSDREDKPKGKLVSAIFKKELRPEEKRTRIAKDRPTDKSEKKKRLESDLSRPKKIFEDITRRPSSEPNRHEVIKQENEPRRDSEKRSSEESKRPVTMENKRRSEDTRKRFDESELRPSSEEATGSKRPSVEPKLKRSSEEPKSKQSSEEPRPKRDKISSNKSDEIVPNGPKQSSSIDVSPKKELERRKVERVPISKSFSHESSPTPAKSQTNSTKQSLPEAKIKQEDSLDASATNVKESKIQTELEVELAKEKEKEKEREAQNTRDLLTVKREKERKEREKKMLLQLEVEEKRKLEKRKRDEELEKQQKEKEREEEIKQKAREAAVEQERQRQLQATAEAEARKNQPYGLRMANYGARSIEETLEYLPLLVRRFRSGAAAITTSDKMGSYVIDMQVGLLLGVQNIYQACKYMQTRLLELC